jgi:membrane protein implicated in regulation of membrane protease activity
VKTGGPLLIFTFAFYLFTFAFTAALALLSYAALLSRHRKSSSRPLRLVGRVASVERDLEPEGFVLLDGELWRARVCGGASSVRAPVRVRVTGARGCVLEVERFEHEVGRLD